MVKTMMPGEGDGMSRDELESLEREMHYAEIRQRVADPIGRRLLRAAVFGTEERLEPFEPPHYVFPSLFSHSSN